MEPVIKEDKFGLGFTPGSQKNEVGTLSSRGLVSPHIVNVADEDKALVVNLKVAPSDMGKVIGKSGRIAKSIRAVVSAAASKSDKKVIVEIDN